MKPKDYIKLGSPLDELLNEIGTTTPHPGGIRLPREGHPGTGNIVIQGMPGTGKSTLAMQIAQMCTKEGNGFLAAYVSLEQPVDHILHRAEMFGWRESLHPVLQLHDIPGSPSPEDLGELLMSIMTQPSSCPFLTGEPSGCKPEHLAELTARACVLVPSMSPRTLAPEETNRDRLFWERYRQLEHLLEGAKWLKLNRPKAPRLGVVCIDSLNVFGDKPLSREELFRIFDLFRRQEVIGVFVAEESNDDCDAQERNTIAFLADTVIVLSTYEDQAFSLRCMEIVKSRYQPQVHGRHPFKVKSLRPVGGNPA